MAGATAAVSTQATQHLRAQLGRAVGLVALLGDNAGRSYDSRQAGYFPAERILGVVW